MWQADHGNDYGNIDKIEYSITGDVDVDAMLRNRQWQNKNISNIFNRVDAIIFIRGKRH